LSVVIGQLSVVAGVLHLKITTLEEQPGSLEKYAQQGFKSIEVIKKKTLAPEP